MLRHATKWYSTKQYSDSLCLIFDIIGIPLNHSNHKYFQEMAGSRQGTAGPPMPPASGVPPASLRCLETVEKLLMRHDRVGRGVGLDPQRCVGDEADLRGRGLLQLAVGAAMHVVLPHRHVALLRQRMGHRAGIRSAK